MVYSQTKRTASIASITNQNQGGGNKKAGLPYLVGRESWSSIALKGTSQNLSVLKMPLVSTVNPSRPVSVRPGSTHYFKLK
jgi:hypothetical protein|tara:strand:- start:5700 stop:5942 length:243 start_codon:yes stop_codon:yes gene_type:complete